MKKQQEVKNPDLEHISLLIELEKTCANLAQKANSGSVIDILMNTMRGMRGNLTLRALTERSLKDTIDKVIQEVQQQSAEYLKSLRDKLLSLRKKGTKEADQSANELEKIIKEQEGYQEKIRNAKDGEQAVQLLNEYKQRDTENLIEETMKKYEEDAQKAQLQSQLLAQIDDQIAKIQQHISDLQKVGTKDALAAIQQLEQLLKQEQEFKKKVADAKDQKELQGVTDAYKSHNTPQKVDEIMSAFQLSNKKEQLRGKLLQDVTDSINKLQDEIAKYKKIGTKEALKAAADLEKLLQNWQSLQKQISEATDINQLALLLDQFKKQNLPQDIADISAEYENSLKRQLLQNKALENLTAQQLETQQLIDMLTSIGTENALDAVKQLQQHLSELNSKIQNIQTAPYDLLQQYCEPSDFNSTLLANYKKLQNDEMNSMRAEVMKRIIEFRQTAHVTPGKELEPLVDQCRIKDAPVETAQLIVQLKTELKQKLIKFANDFIQQINDQIDVLGQIDSPEAKEALKILLEMQQNEQNIVTCVKNNETPPLPSNYDEFNKIKNTQYLPSMDKATLEKLRQRILDASTVMYNAIAERIGQLQEDGSTEALAIADLLIPYLIKETEIQEQLTNAGEKELEKIFKEYIERDISELVGLLKEFGNNAIKAQASLTQSAGSSRQQSKRTRKSTRTNSRSRVAKRKQVGLSQEDFDKRLQDMLILQMQAKNEKDRAKIKSDIDQFICSQEEAIQEEMQFENQEQINRMQDVLGGKATKLIIAEYSDLLKQLQDAYAEYRGKLLNIQRCDYVFDVKGYVDIIETLAAFDSTTNVRCMPSYDVKYINNYKQVVLKESDTFIEALDMVVEHQQTFRNPNINDIAMVKELEAKFQKIVQSAKSCETVQQLVNAFDDIRECIKFKLLDLDSVTRTMETMIQKILDTSTNAYNILVECVNELQSIATPDALAKSELLLPLIVEEQELQEQAMQMTECDSIFKLYNDYLQKDPLFKMKQILARK
ncbi:Conserved_hypothetical protein [Hexamita inflata]|uniref:Uncharacterized protein n=1 Tax=Hexamita inflata TaxID=28002 RepID=A0AA86QH25_9EUKA|nr:Conserved hypothetical protein [Hexamita inflata]